MVSTEGNVVADSRTLKSHSLGKTRHLYHLTTCMQELASRGNGYSPLPPACGTHRQEEKMASTHMHMQVVLVGSSMPILATHATLVDGTLPHASEGVPANIKWL